MLSNFDYTGYARRFATRFPMLNYVGMQITFWVAANIFLSLIIHFFSLAIDEILLRDMHPRLAPIVILAVFIGVLYGSVLGLADYYLDQQFFRQRPVGKIIVLKTILSAIMLVVAFQLTRYVLFDLFIATSFFNRAGVIINNQAWRYIFVLLMIYYLVMTLFISFINQVNRKYGPGVLVPILLGRYRNPREEERIFLFMDLKSSTAIAEALGHLRYSTFIRDSFRDISQIIGLFDAEIYQYVGDEIVVSWRIDKDLDYMKCIRFFFACEAEFERRSDYYIHHYNIMPQFKAGAHMGKVTAVEIGDIKRDIAYHGDPLNTAARIQSVCNEYHHTFLVSEYLFDHLEHPEQLTIERLGMIQFKGKLHRVGVVGIVSLDGNPLQEKQTAQTNQAPTLGGNDGHARINR